MAFYDIIKTNDIIISVPVDSHFSIGTSPYYAHQYGLAIDIYQNLSLKNYDVLSPVSGKVIKTKKLLAPKAKFKGGIDFDYITLIQNADNSDLVFKLLHVKPKVKIDEQIDLGDTIGITIRNGYFASWSSPHTHLEIRKINDPIRARGAIAFSLSLGNPTQQNQQVIDDSDNIPLEIISIFPEFILARLTQKFYCKIGAIFGLKGQTDKFNCILDGGLPHYKHGIIITENRKDITLNSPVYLSGYELGSLDEFHNNFGLFKFKNIKLLLDNKEIRGISLYLACFNPLIKIIPYNFKDFLINPKSTCFLTINSN